MIYLAVPYSHPDPAVREKRYRKVTEVAAKMAARGIHVFSPITHCHPMIEFADLPGSWEYWRDYDRCMLSICRELHVLCLPGWEESVGVQAEITIAEEIGVKVFKIFLKEESEND